MKHIKSLSKTMPSKAAGFGDVIKEWIEEIKDIIFPS